MKTLRIIAFFFLSLALGGCLARIYNDQEIDTPQLNRAVQWIIGLFDPLSAGNPDVVFDVGTIISLIVATILAGTAIYIGWRLILVFRHRSHVTSSPY